MAARGSASGEGGRTDLWREGAGRREAGSVVVSGATDTRLLALSVASSIGSTSCGRFVSTCQSSAGVRWMSSNSYPLERWCEVVAPRLLPLGRVLKQRRPDNEASADLPPSGTMKRSRGFCTSP